MRKFVAAGLFVGALVVSGCSGGNRAEESSANAPMDSSAASATAPSPEASFKTSMGGGKVSMADRNPSAPSMSLASVTAPAERAVIRTARLTIRVDDVAKSEKSANDTIRKMQGYVESATSSDLASETPTLTMQCRIPAKFFDSSLEIFEALGTRMSKTVASQDVTEQIVDMDARARTMAAEEETLRGILKGTRQLDSMMQVQQRLTELRGQIESMAAQRKSLATQATYSTVELTLTQKADALVAAKADPNWSGQAWGEAWSSAAGFGRGLTVFGIWLLAYSPLWILVGVVVWVGVRQMRRGRPVAPPQM